MFRVSIPYSPIKRDKDKVLVVPRAVFQYLIVQLKENGDEKQIRPEIGFQYLIIQLKGSLYGCVT